MNFKEAFMSALISWTRSPSLLSVLSLVVIAIFTVFLSSGPAVANTGYSVDPVFATANSGEECEKELQSYTPVKVTRSPLIEELHRERQAGNMTAFRNLEAQITEPQPEGESAGGTILIPTTTFGRAGDLKMQQSGEIKPIENTPPAGIVYGNDKKVRAVNFDTLEYRQSMVSDSNGNLYIAWVDTTTTTYIYLQLYKSTDGGKTWVPFGYLQNPSHSLVNPSLAVGEGSNGNKLLIAYTVDDWYGMDWPEVATTPLTAANFSVHSVPIYPTWHDYRNSRIVTDSFKYGSWFAYLTCEGVFQSAYNNVNIVAWRSMDGGETWGDEEVVFGNMDDFHWDAPDLSFGTTWNRLFISCFCHDLSGIYTINSDSYGTTWNSMILFKTLDVSLLEYEVDPEIAAAVNHDNVMICCTKYSTAHDSADVGQGYSQDAGETWTTLWDINGSSDFNELAPYLIANEGGGHWHVAWTCEEEQTVYYSRRPQDLSTGWQVIPYAISDTCTASPIFSRKGIASIWDTDVACICWADRRDGIPNDYDCYVDIGDNPGLMTSRTAIKEDDGAYVDFFLNAGEDNGGRSYVIVGSASGTSPGTPLPGGHVVLPLNWDIFSNFVLTYMNSALFIQFMGTLDQYGLALALMNCPPIPGYAGLELNFAYALRGPYDFVSNPVKIRIRD